MISLDVGLMIAHYFDDDTMMILNGTLSWDADTDNPMPQSHLPYVSQKLYTKSGFHND